MNSKNQVTIPTNRLKCALARFDEWRDGRESRQSRIPDELWEIALRCAEQSGVKCTAKHLKLNYERLSKRFKLKGLEEESSGEESSFVEVPSVMCTGRIECKVELSDSKGSSMQIELQGGSISELSTLAEAFYKSVL